MSALVESARLAAGELRRGAAGAAGSLLDQVRAVQEGLAAGPAPAPAQLREGLTRARAGVDGAAGSLGGQLDGGLAAVELALAAGARAAGSELGEAGAAAREAAAGEEEAGREAFDSLAAGARAGFAAIREGQLRTTTGIEGEALAGLAAVGDDLAAAYERINGGLREGFRSAPAKLEEALRGAFPKMQEEITTEADKAAAKEQPAWKSVVKWVLIIAIVIVVAVVVGPFVIGAMAGFLGSGLLATVVGGAIVGAAASSAIQVVSNWAEGRKLTEDLLQAAVTGAIGGALGAAAGFALQNLGSAVVRFGLETAADLVVDTGLTLATGDFTWENLGVSLLMGVAFNLGTSGLSASTRVGRFQARAMGSGHSLGAGARGRLGRAPRVDATPGAPRSSGPEPEVEAPAPRPTEPESAGPRPAEPGGEPAAPRPEGPAAEPAAPRPPDAGGEPSGPRPTAPEAEPGAGTSRPLEEGVAASVNGEGGHQVKVLDDGRVIRCSTCAEFGVEFGAALARHGDLADQWQGLQSVADPEVRAARAADLADRIRAREAERLRGLADEAGVDLPPRELDAALKSADSFEDTVRRVEDAIAARSAELGGGKSAQVAREFEEAGALGPEPGRPPEGAPAVSKLKTDVKLMHDVGVEGGRTQADADGVTVEPWNNPEAWIPDYGRGLDDVGRRGGDLIVLEWKGGSSKLRSGQLSDTWVGKRIAKLAFLGDPMTATLLAAGLQGRLKGRLYRTTLDEQARMHTRLEGGERSYSPETLLEAYQKELTRLLNRKSKQSKARKTKSKNPQSPQ